MRCRLRCSQTGKHILQIPQLTVVVNKQQPVIKGGGDEHAGKEEAGHTHILYNKDPQKMQAIQSTR